MVTKISISLDDDVLEDIELRAKQLEISRSECIQRYIRKGMEKPESPEVLNKLYGDY